MRLLAVCAVICPVLECYKGAVKMLKAKNTGNPLSKLSFFKRGKNWIASALARDTTAVESHFIRFSIQRNSLGSLGYNQHIKQDSLMIAEALPHMDDKDLKVKFTDYFNRLKMSPKSE